ncbi:hypothetical protein [Ruficoccus sp. ZRK36]|uniref:hypothetical protein n=1 Tax=Ruficoccus sp. ZRK36 TaxID=2866311 RepID=UPI001C72DD44|nr:hypothetical protein [Ruficoccus sp. ZRK36]QYY36731.1 hypothetical protein K0V07_04465 [Ruficoccus sp. ZRK36]
MSSLKERIEARLRQAKTDKSLPPPCVASHPTSKDLLLIDENCQCWQLPWSCLQYSSRNKDGDHFHLSFKTHEVWLYGKYLTEPTQSLARREIVSIRAFGSKHTKRSRPDHAFVERMTVTSKDNPRILVL